MGMLSSDPISTRPISGKRVRGIKSKKPVGVFSDMVIRNGDISFSDFLTMFSNGSAVGFSNFLPFVEGNYTYAQALIKTTMRSYVGNVSPSLAKLTAIVDVPDVVETGKLKTDGDNFRTVYMSRKFHVPPVVNVTLLSGIATGTPTVRNITHETFEVAVITEAGDLIEADINWHASGY